ncbi:cilia- and flagella-associated protein 418 isoform X2 [Dunckerocampus dactyliophorus]|uniref:cilia- and flagella-associated protein 418 isoform X2 n=1 Tax=Dunckerocampus dactyliophorus TaxID=161453 RepID=UPI002405D0D2|nr:cilia- and flagella-associated protein 418 isoform X2 [Dunckerocampus dactyliophorus]
MDGDNLDELLDEVEKKFFRNVSVTDDCRASSKKDKKCGKDSDVRGEVGCTGHGGQRGSITDDIDALLEELKDEDHSDSPLAKHPKSRRAEQTPPCHSGGRKCCPVYLGGSAITNGVGTATSKRSCDQLRCTSCDFRVLTFDGWEWDPSCDYLFLRNNMPDHEKLRGKLRKRNGVRAYACQCSWFSTLDATDVLLQPQLRWVCGKHLD